MWSISNIRKVLDLIIDLVICVSLFALLFAGLILFAA